MTRRSLQRRTLAAGAMALLSALAAPTGPLAAQSVNGDGYMFGRPTATLQLRVGAGRPNASSGVFDFASERLTLSPNDYLGITLGADIGIPITQQFELQFSASTTARRAESEYRDYIDNNDLPIEQTTRLRRTPLSLGLRYNLVPAGRRISKLAWVPSKLVPYVAAGGGAMWYRFQQNGDFVDYQTLDVFSSRLKSEGWTGMGYASTGVTWNFKPVVALNTELRYDHANGPLTGDFDGFDRIQLSGVGFTTGLVFRF